MSREWRVGMAWEDGCARLTMRSTGNWESTSSTAGGGRRDGGLGGRMADVSEKRQREGAPVQT